MSFIVVIDAILVMLAMLLFLWTWAKSKSKKSKAQSDGSSSNTQKISAKNRSWSALEDCVLGDNRGVNRRGGVGGLLFFVSICKARPA